jgi:CRISPR type I-E-associated protein CasB/Cse2
MSETRQSKFVEFLEKHAEDRAMLAALRRGLGRKVGETAEMFPYVVPFIYDRYQEASVYLVGSLFALHPRSAHNGNMGNHLKAYSQAKGFKKTSEDDATTRRFVQLLRFSQEAIDTPLRQQINLLKSADVAVNWHQLFYDLSRWEHEDRFVQRNWASEFWSDVSFSEKA